MSSHEAELPGGGRGGEACCAPKENLCRNPEAAALADLFRALGHPVRIGILKEIIQRQEASCGEIVGSPAAGPVHSVPAPAGAEGGGASDLRDPRAQLFLPDQRGLSDRRGRCGCAPAG